MTRRLLRIDASARLNGSLSRELGDAFQATWIGQHPGGEVALRDLAREPVPHISEKTIAGFFTPEEEKTPELRSATAVSDSLIAELLGADDLLLTVPIYNFSIPSALKAYIDHVVRIGRTFALDPERGFYGLVRGKRAFVTAAYGSAGYFDGPLGALNFLEPYLRSLLGFLGIEDVTFFSVEGTATGAGDVPARKGEAIREIERALRPAA